MRSHHPGRGGKSHPLVMVGIGVVVLLRAAGTDPPGRAARRWVGARDRLWGRLRDQARRSDGCSSRAGGLYFVEVAATRGALAPTGAGCTGVAVTSQRPGATCGTRVVTAIRPEPGITRSTVEIVWKLVRSSVASPTSRPRRSTVTGWGSPVVLASNQYVTPREWSAAFSSAAQLRSVMSTTERGGFLSSRGARPAAGPARSSACLRQVLRTVRGAAPCGTANRPRGFVKSSSGPTLNAHRRGVH